MRVSSTADTMRSEDIGVRRGLGFRWRDDGGRGGGKCMHAFSFRGGDVNVDISRGGWVAAAGGVVLFKNSACEGLTYGYDI